MGTRVMVLNARDRDEFVFLFVTRQKRDRSVCHEKAGNAPQNQHNLVQIHETLFEEFAPWDLPFRDHKIMEYPLSPSHFVPKGKPQEEVPWVCTCVLRSPPSDSQLHITFHSNRQSSVASFHSTPTGPPVFDGAGWSFGCGRGG